MSPRAVDNRYRASLWVHLTTAATFVALLLLTGCQGHDFSLPELRTLAVTGSANAMFPAFQRSRTHYAIYPSDTDQLALSVSTQNPQDWISINSADWQLGSAEVDLTAIAPGTDIIITVLDAFHTKNHYVVHYLPEDFPSVEITQRDNNVTDGLFFIAARVRNGAVTNSYLIVLDNEGVPHFYRFVTGQVLDFKLQPDGHITYAVSNGRNEFGNSEFENVILNPLLQEERRVTTVGLNNTDGHDFIITPEGTFLLISYDTQIRDMTEFGLSATEEVGDSVIQEIDPDGNLLWEWRSWGIIDLNDCTQFRLFPSDYAHLNSLYLTDDDAIVASFRGCSQVLKIQRGTGEILWLLGGSQSTMTIEDDPFGEFCGQHTAVEFTENQLFLFDNGAFCIGDREEVFGQFSRYVEYELDPASGTARFVRQASPFGAFDEFTRSQGSIQPLADGHRLLSWGNGPPVSVTEVDANDQEIFSMVLMDAEGVTTTYRAFRYPSYSPPLDPPVPPLPD